MLSSESGYIVEMNTREIGMLSVSLGAGRMKKDDAVDPAAGIVIHKKIGASVQKGESIATLYTNRSDNPDGFIHRYNEAIIISDEEPIIPQLINERIEAD